MSGRRKLRVGEWVQIRSKEDILRTLDKNGQLEGMPFMPEMFEFCGKRLQVSKRAHKSCDPDFFSRRIEGAVHLETRCNGLAHGGCQAGCTFFWKEAWLIPLSSPHANPEPRPQQSASGGCDEAAVFAGTQERGAEGSGPTYICQTTQVPHAGKLLPWWDLRQYLEDYTSGNITLGRLISGSLYSIYYNLSQAGMGLGPAMRGLYDLLRPLWHGGQWPRKSGLIPAGQPTPVLALDLQPGELVRVRAHDEILQTVTTDNKNRGMWWDAELVPYCEGTYKVLQRITRIIDEKTGKMLEMKMPSIALEGVTCQARYSACRMFCPRGTYAYWREVWLERPEQTPAVVSDLVTISASRLEGTRK